VGESLRHIFTRGAGRPEGLGLVRPATAAGGKAKEKVHTPVAEGEPWTSELRDPKLSAHNTTMSSAVLDSGGVVGIWILCICENCQYVPLDEEIMSLRQDLLLIQATDEHMPNLLLCPKCERPLRPRLYYDITTFTAVTRTVRTPAPGEAGEDGGFFAATVDSPGQQEAFLRRGASEIVIREGLKGEISGCALGTCQGGLVEYMSPFTLRMRLEKLLLEHGEECLTREWARVHHPELYWNLVWFTTRLSVPFPLLLDSLDLMPIEAGATAPLSSDGSMGSTGGRRGLTRRESAERLQNFFHEVVVVGWEGLCVRARCHKVAEMLQSRAFVPTPRGPLNPAPPPAPAPAPSTLPSSLQNAVAPLASILPTGGSSGGLAAADKAAAPREAIGPLAVHEVFPNLSNRKTGKVQKSELDALSEVADILTRKGANGLKEAVSKFLQYRGQFGGWTSEGTLGNMYRVFLKLAANYRIRKLHNIAPIQNLTANPGFEHEYWHVVTNLSGKQLREEAERDEKALLAELPKRDAIKFRSVFGHLY
jgi:hypothetical protein